MELTGNQDVDLKILLELPSSALLNICLTNRYLNSLCQKEDFWQSRIRQEFGSEYLDYKKPGTTYRQQYMNLVMMLQPNRDLWTRFYSWLFPVSQQEQVNRAAARGHLDVVVQSQMLPDEIGATLALLNDQFHLVDWLIERNIWPLTIPIVQRGRLDLLIYLEEKGKRLTQLDADLAALEGQRTILQWLADRGVRPGTLGANAAQREGHDDIVEWLSSFNIRPDQARSSYPHFIKSHYDSELSKYEM